MNTLDKPVDPYQARRSEVVLSGFDGSEVLIYQEVMSLYDYYEEVGHVFDSGEELAKRGIRRMHFVLWDSDKYVQSEGENYHDENGRMNKKSR